MKLPNELEKCSYIGDGVYIGLSMGAIWLITFDGMRTTNEICLEPEVVQSLKKYLDSLTVRT